MSRIWKLPIAILDWVSVKLTDSVVSVTWPKGSLEYSLLKWVSVDVQASEILVSVDSDDLKKFWGLTRSLINNMIVGVKNWYEKKLLVLGVWYTAKVKWRVLHLNLWYSHPIDHNLPDWIESVVEQDPKWNIVVVITWIDKQLVGQEAAKIRSYRKPEPYKWKWVRYVGEYIEMKAWKTAWK